MWSVIEINTSVIRIKNNVLLYKKNGFNYGIKSEN